MIKTADLQVWLTSQGVAPDAWNYDGYVPPMPDRVLVLSSSGGAPTRMERAFDTVSMQILARGKQMVPADSEDLIAQVDDAVMNAVCPQSIGAHRVIDMDRVGGPPRFLQYDTSERALFVCNYLFTIARQ